MTTTNDTSKSAECWWPVSRGGPSAGGGYDRMNRTYTGDCGKPTTGPDLLCDRHRAKNLEKRVYREAMETGARQRAEFYAKKAKS